MLTRKTNLNEKSQLKKEFSKKLHAWFQELWDGMTLPRKCMICEKKIYGENRTIYWDHLIEKANRKDIAFEKWNIIFVCDDCHTNRHNGIIPLKYLEWIEFAKIMDKGNG